MTLSTTIGNLLANVLLHLVVISIPCYIQERDIRTYASVISILFN